MSESKSQELRYGIWPTAWGPMGAVATPEGIVKVLLPHYSPTDLDEMLKWENPGATRDDKHRPFELQGIPVLRKQAWPPLIERRHVCLPGVALAGARPPLIALDQRRSRRSAYHLDKLASVAFPQL